MLAPSLDIGRLSAPGRLEISLFLEKFSLIRLWKFPVPLRREFGCRLLNPRVDLTRKSPVSREFGAETGSQLTASSAKQSGLCGPCLICYHGSLGRFFRLTCSFFCRKCFSQSLRPISATWSRSKSRSVPFVMVPEESRLQPVGVCVMPLRSIVN